MLCWLRIRTKGFATRAALLLVFIPSVTWLSGCSDPTKVLQQPRSTETDSVGLAANHQPPMVAEQQSAFIERLRPQVESFCGACHAPPVPGSIVKADWPGEVYQGFEFYRSSGRHDLHPPSQEDVTNFFVFQAPDELTMPTTIVGNPPTTLSFQPTPVFKKLDSEADSRPPCISGMKWINLGNESGSALVYSDLSTGGVYAYWPLRKDQAPKRLAVLYQPARIEPCDLNGDSRTDLVVADLGEFLPADSDLGRIVWLRRLPTGDEFERVILQEGLGRVADVRPADFDSDGDTDLLVAEFGWRKTGRILLLENQGSNDTEKPSFQLRELDRRHGAIHLPTVDLNHDGHLDFVALISQEFESVEAFINDGKGNFSRQVIWSAPDPAYGSSGIEIADVDNDGDQDVVYSNGDSFDHGAKPYHSVQWLENLGSFPFTHHHLTFMPGVLAINVDDVDADEDLDILAVSLMGLPLSDSLEAAGVESVVTLEQVTPGNFKRTRLEVSESKHGTIETGDFNSDGRTDIAVGNFFRNEEAGKPDFTIWLNRR